MRRTIALAGAVAGLVALAWLAWPEPPADRASVADAPGTASTRAAEPPARGPARPSGPAPKRSGPRAETAEPTGQMILNVVGPHGALVDDVRIDVQVFLSLGVWDRAGIATRRQDGAWVVVRENLGERAALVRAPAGRTVFVRSPRLGEIAVPFENGATIDVRFQDPVRLAVRFEGIPETFASHILAAVPPRSHEGHPARWEVGLVGYAKLLPSGRADYGPVQPGPRDVVLVFRNDDPPWPRAGFWHIGRWSPDAQSGRSEIVLRVPDLFALDVRFEGAGTDTVLTLEHAPRRADASRQWVHVGSQGIARFELVPAGRYTVRHHEAGAMVVDVPAPGIVAFAPALFNALRIDGARGYWAQASLQDGDLVVGINGRRFEPSPDTSRWLPHGLRPADETVTLLVREPSGRERDVEVALFRFLGGKGEDGHLVPVFR